MASHSSDHQEDVKSSDKNDAQCSNSPERGASDFSNDVIPKMNDDQADLQNIASSLHGNEDALEKCCAPPFTMHGVLHYLQNEWARFESERADWEMERAELQAKIAFLMGERKGQENLKRDLVMRIKMLESSLKKERIKVHKLIHGEDPAAELIYNSDNSDSETNSLAPSTSVTEKGNFTWSEARQILRQYLKEMGYSEKVVNNEEFRVKNLFQHSVKGRTEKEVLKKEQTILDTANLIRRSRKIDNTCVIISSGLPPVGEDDCGSEEEDEKNLDTETMEALEEFSFLRKECNGTQRTCDTSPTCNNLST